jgi:hypothetical protein
VTAAGRDPLLQPLDAIVEGRALQLLDAQKPRGGGLARRAYRKTAAIESAT